MAIWSKYVAVSIRDLAKSQDWQHDTLRHIKRKRKKKDTCVWNSVQNRSLVSSGRMARVSQRLEESCKWSYCLISTNATPPNTCQQTLRPAERWLNSAPRKEPTQLLVFILFILCWLISALEHHSTEFSVSFTKLLLKLVIAVTPW